MIFRLKTAGCYYEKNDKYLDLLKDLGFSFKPSNETFRYINKNNMVTIEINSLQDLEELQNKMEHKLVITFGKNPTIVIYDDYLE